MVSPSGFIFPVAPHSPRLPSSRARRFHPPVSVPPFPHIPASSALPLATERKSESGEDDRLLFAVSEMQGWRISASPTILHPLLLTIPVSPAMEDAHAAVLSLEDGTEEKNAFFAVYDGHGGNFLPSSSSLISLLAYRQHRRKICRKKCS